MINKQDCVIRILYKCVRSPSPNSGIIPVITPLSLTFCKIAASASPTKLSRSGDRGSPCLSPLYVLKYSPVSPFKLMGILPPLTTFSTQFIHLLLKPFLYSTSLKIFQLTLSYTFSKSSFRMITSSCSLIHEVLRVEWPHHPVYTSPAQRLFGSCLSRLNVSVFIIILYITFNKQIGLILSDVDCPFHFWQ